MMITTDYLAVFSVFVGSCH